MKLSYCTCCHICYKGSDSDLCTLNECKGLNVQGCEADITSTQLNSSSLCHYFRFMVVFLATATALCSFMRCPLEPARLKASTACL